MADIQDTEGLIIDLRFNSGGEDEVIEVLINPAGDSQYLAPVVLLTSTTTGSAAEVFVLSMRNLPNVTIIGESTAGRFSNQLVSRVTSDIAFSLSNEFYFSPAGEWFERVGIPVDQTVPFYTREILDQGRNAGVEIAIELLSP